MKENYIAAIEIGSSKIIGAVGIFHPDNNSLDIIAAEQLDSHEAVRYGIIQNPEEVASRVSRIIEQLNANPAVSPRRINKVFVGLSGRSMRSISSEVKLLFPEDTEISGEMLTQLQRDATSIAIDPNLEILATIPRSYNIDGLETTSPKGAMGKSIEATFDIIVGRMELKRNIQRAITDRLGLEIKGYIITPIASADVVLSDEEKRLGCMLVDFGAETSSVSIFRKGALCYYATLPLGGRNITRDLTTLNMLEERAEQIKCESGKAIPLETPSTLNIYGIRLADVSNLVVARAEEIVANVIQQINYAGLKEKDLPAGIICIGGGSKLNGLLELIENQTRLNARRGNLRQDIHTAEPRSKRIDSIQTAAILYAGGLTGAEDCLESPQITDPNPETDNIINIPHPDGGEGKETKAGGFFSRLGSKFSNFFAPPTDDESELD